MNKEEQALELRKKSIVIDGLIGGLFSATNEERIATFEEFIKAGVTAGNVTVNTVYGTPWQKMEELKSWYDMFEKYSDKVVLATMSCDVERAKKEGKFGIIMGSQDADMIGDDLDLLSVYKKLGLRIIQLSYYRQNLLGEGSGERTDGGLSNFGIEVVQEMNRLGLLIDIAHCKDRVTLDAIQYSKDPVIASHSNVRELVNHARNKTSEQIKALAEKGGIIGLIAWSPFCEIRKGVRPTFEDLFDMADYAVKLVGPEHVGIGTDLSQFTKEAYEEWAQFYPDLRPTGGWLERSLFTNKEGREDISLFPEITKGLLARGYSDQDVEKILGLNFLRVFKEVCG